jgi:Sulfotransferase family
VRHSSSAYATFLSERSNEFLQHITLCGGTTFIPAMKAYDPHSPLISLHIPKTGGTSLRHTLEEWFPEGRLFTHYFANGQLPARHQLTGNVCVHGHFNAARGFGCSQYYPDIDQFITFLREPFGRFLSTWFFRSGLRRAGLFTAGSENDTDFKTYLFDCAELMAQNRYLHTFLHQFPDTAHYSESIGLMDRKFVFVGIMERYADSLNALSTALGKPPSTVAHLNQSEHTEDFGSWRVFYEKHFAPEYEIYEAALSRNA